MAGTVVLDLNRMNRVHMTRDQWRRSWPAWLRGTAIGFPFGCIPAGGSEIPTFLSYAAEKKLSKHKDEFGTRGAIEEWADFLIAGRPSEVQVLHHLVRTLCSVAALGQASPVKWSILALEGAIWRDFTAQQMLLPCVVLVAIAPGPNQSIELETKIPHELAHVKNRDMLTMTIAATLGGAIGMLSALLLRHLGADGLQRWRDTDRLDVFHYGSGKTLPLRPVAVALGKAVGQAIPWGTRTLRGEAADQPAPEEAVGTGDVVPRHAIDRTVATARQERGRVGTHHRCPLRLGHLVLPQEEVRLDLDLRLARLAAPAAEPAPAPGLRALATSAGEGGREARERRTSMAPSTMPPQSRSMSSSSRAKNNGRFRPSGRATRRGRFASRRLFKGITASHLNFSILKHFQVNNIPLLSITLIAPA